MMRFFRTLRVRAGGGVTPGLPRDAMPDNSRVADLPTKGYRAAATETPFVDYLSDADLEQLNRLLPWQAFTADRHGRRFGSGRQGKRDVAAPVPDRRVRLLDEHFRLADKHVLEVGCFEGIHTVGLAMVARQVTAVDARVENVVKTIVRAAFFGYTPRVFKCDLEARPLRMEWLQADVVFHVGVLYHLQDPVSHLLELGQFIRLGALLDTHYALEEEADLTYDVGGRGYRFRRRKEGGLSDAFSGMADHSKWLTLAGIVDLLKEGGFPTVAVIEKREERHGPRALLVARRSGS
jgi:SAM-dependent methyltransferase